MEHEINMRLDVGIPLNMWIYIINTILYLINKVLPNSLGCGGQVHQDGVEKWGYKWTLFFS